MRWTRKRRRNGMIGRKAMLRRRDKRLDDVLIVLISAIPLSVFFDL